MKRPEPVQIVKQRRDVALRALVSGVPYIQYLGMKFDRRGDELTGVLPFDEKLIGNPLLPALHGGVTAAFLEVTAMITLSWSYLWEDIENGNLDFDPVEGMRLPRLPKTVDFSVDYLRSGLPRDAYARAPRCLCARAREPVRSTICLCSCGRLARQADQAFCASDWAFCYAATALE